MNRVSVLLSAYRPGEELPELLRGLREAGFADLLVVDDGSGPEFAERFRRAQAVPGCTVLRHPAKRGRGAALKTAMAFFLRHRPGQAGVAAVDAAGGYLPRDVSAAARTMAESGRVVLGARISRRAVSRLNAAVLRLFLGMQVHDPRAGLLAVPRGYLPQLAETEGEGEDYGANVIFWISRGRIPFQEVAVAAADGGGAPRRAARDSLRIYGLIAKYLASSLGACAVDELAFFLLKLSGFLAFLPIPATFTAALLARVISSLMNFFINARVVFAGQVSTRALGRYYLLAACQITASAALVFLAEHLFAITSPALSTLAKILVDTLLFFISFRVQHRWVFRRNEDSPPSGKDQTT